MFKRMPLPFIYVLATGVVLGLVIGFKSFIPYLYWGETGEYEWYRSALPHVINYLFWPLLVPFIYWSFERFKIARGASLTDRLVTLLMSALIPFVHESTTTVIYFYLLELMGKYEFNAESWSLVKAAFPSVYIGRIVEYWIIYGLFAAFDYYKKYKDKQAELGRIEAQLNRTKLAVLKMQLQPHFLFNALNSISSLMEIDVKKAQIVTARLGDLLRGILEQDQRIFITLEEELKYVKTYLEIEKIRFEDRLTVTYNVEENLSGATVPMLLIQPLVENAIKHGIARLSRPGELAIGVTGVSRSRMRISVADNGMGQNMQQEEIFSKGIGLRNVKDRLWELFGEDYTLRISTHRNQGFAIEIELPIRNYHEKYSHDHSR